MAGGSIPGDRMSVKRRVLSSGLFVGSVFVIGEECGSVASTLVREVDPSKSVQFRFQWKKKDPAAFEQLRDLSGFVF